MDTYELVRDNGRTAAVKVTLGDGRTFRLGILNDRPAEDEVIEYGPVVRLADGREFATGRRVWGLIGWWI